MVVSLSAVLFELSVLAVSVQPFEAVLLVVVVAGPVAVLAGDSTGSDLVILMFFVHPEIIKEILTLSLITNMLSLCSRQIMRNFCSSFV